MGSAETGSDERRDPHPLGDRARRPTAAEQLLPLVYEELRKLAPQKLAHEKPGQTLQATALVHEAYFGWWADGPRSDGTAAATSSPPRPRPCAASSSTGPGASGPRKAGGGRRRLELDDIEPALEEANDGRLLALDEALRQLEAEDPRKAELVKLRFFAGLTAEQAAAVLGVSTSTAEKHWAYARSWLRVAIDRLSGDSVLTDRKRSLPGPAPISRIVSGRAAAARSRRLP